MFVWLGLAMTAGAIGSLWRLTLSQPARRPYPLYGWIGVVALVVLEALLLLRVPFVTAFFTALVWTAYILATDGAVYRLTGTSQLHHPGRFFALSLLSIPGWLIFEAYNFELKNWVYAGVPQNFWVFAVGGCWAFATIYPGVFETADLIYAARLHRARCRPLRFTRPIHLGLALLGAILLAFPLLMDRHWAPYLFGPVWAGFIFLLDPINRHFGLPSMLGDLADGRPGRFWALLLSGLCCGFFWEFWNYWATARWIYVFPILQRSKVFAMPLPGFLGFPPFVVECFTMAIFFGGMLLPEELRPALMRDRAE